MGVTNKKQIIITSVLIIILVFGAWAGWYYWWRLEPVREAYKIHETELALQQSDIIGGNTPEQTWQMFLTALRAEDLDLASKYFVLKKQEEWREDLEKVKEKGMLNNMIDELSSAPEQWKKVESIMTSGGDVAQFLYIYKNFEHTITLEKNINNKWKIRSL